MDQIGILQLSWAQGYSGTKVEYIDRDTLCYKCGNCVKFVYNDGQESVLPSPGDGVGALAIHNQNKVFAFTEACLEPRIFVFSYPVFQSVAEMKGGASLEYSHLAFSSSDYLVSVTSLPEFELTLWKYETGEKLCSASLSHVIPTSVSFSPTDWRQICVTSDKEIGLWNVEQAHDQYVIIKQPIRLPSITMPTAAIEDHGREDNLPTRASTRMSRMTVELPRAAIAGLVGDMAEEYEELEDQAPRVRPVSHCWDAMGDVYIGCEGGQLIRIDTEMMRLKMIHNPIPAEGLLKQDSSFKLGDKEPSSLSMQSIGSSGYMTPLGEGAFNCLALDRHHLYAGGEDGTIRTLNIKQGEVKVENSHPLGSMITSLAFSPNYANLAIGSTKGTVHIYEPGKPDTAKEFIDLHHGNFVATGFLCPGTDVCVTAREDGEVQAWSMETGKLLSTIPIGLQATTLACSPISHVVAVGSGAGHVYYIDFTNVSEPRLVMRVRVHGGPVKALDYDLHGHFLVSGSDDGHVIVSHGRASRRFEPIGHVTTPKDCEVVAVCTYTNEKSGVMQIVATVNDTKKKRNGATRLIIFQLTENNIHDPPYASLKRDFQDDIVKKIIFNFTTPSYGGALTAGNVFYCLAQNTKHIHKIVIPDDPPKKEYSKDSYLEPEATTPAHSLPSGAVCLSAHHKWLATCSPDGVAHIRGVGTMERALSINPHSYTTGGINTIKFSFDALSIVTTGFDGTLACYKWEFSGQGAVKAKSAQEVARKHNTQHKKDIEEEDQVLQKMVEWSPSPMPSRPGTKHDEVERTDAPQDVDEVYTTPTPTPGADATWVEIREIEAHKEEDKKYADKKKGLRTEIKEMRKIIQTMMRDNETIPDIEKLGRHEFDLDLDEQSRLQAEGRAEVQRIREEIEMDNLAKMYLRELIKKECWDEMIVKGRSIGAFNSNLEVSNYPMRERLDVELEELDRVKQRRTIEIAELKDRRDILEQNSKAAAMPLEKAIREKFNFPPEEENLDPDEVGDGKEQPSTTGSLGNEYGGGSDYFYSQFELMAREQKINQIVLLEDAIYRIKQTFNKEFDDMLTKKEQEIARIKDKNKRIRKIVDDLGVLDEVYEPGLGILEKPEMLLTVEDDEVKVEKYLTPEQQKQKEKAMKIEEERKAREKSDNARERALDMMMGGVLEVKKEDELKKDVPIPAFMSKSQDEWSEEEQKIAKEYEKKVKELQEEREKYRKQLETELKKLQGFIQDGTQNYDDNLNNLFTRKIKTEMVIYQEELKILRLRYALLVEDELNTREKEIIRLVDHKRQCKALASEAYNESRKNVDNFRDGYDILVAEDKVMDKAFKREFHDVPALQVEQLYKLFRRRPRGPRATKEAGHENNPNPFLDRPSTARQNVLAKQSLEAALAELDKDTNMPEGVEDYVWERMCAYRREKIESEQLVKQKALILADMNAFMQKRQEEDERLKNDIDDLTHDLNKLKDDKMRFQCNLEVQLLLKQGQVEVDAGTFIHDYNRSILVHRSVVEDLNAKIRALGEGKISSMVESKDFRKGIIHQEWEHKKMLMEMEDLKNKMRDIQMLKVTREIQAYLNEDDHDAKKVQEIATLEQTIVKQKEVHEKNVEERKRYLKDLKKNIRERQDENKSLDKQLEDLNVNVNERRHIHEVNAEKRSDGGAEKRYQDIVQRRKLVDLAKAQAQEVAVLRAEVERLRMRTFPALVQVER